MAERELPKLETGVRFPSPAPRNDPVRRRVHGVMIEPTNDPILRSQHVRVGADFERTFEDFFGAERDRLFGALCLVTRNRHEAEELSQEAFLKVWERWDRVAGMEDPTGYLYRTAMNAFRSRYRRAALGVRRLMGTIPADDGLAAVEERVMIVARLGRLSEKQRAAIVLMDLLAFSSEEAGRFLGMNAGAVRTLASRGRSELRRQTGDDDA
jgi:RNA polymerase sigma-70 factor, ECF subfamily